MIVLVFVGANAKAQPLALSLSLSLFSLYSLSLSLSLSVSLSAFLLLMSTQASIDGGPLGGLDPPTLKNPQRSSSYRISVTHTRATFDVLEV